MPTGDVATRRRAATGWLGRLAAAHDPVLAYKAGLLAGLSPGSPSARALQAEIPEAPSARALMRIFEQDDRTLHHVYRKWQGPHWTLTCLAMIDYPPGDETLRPLANRVYDWLVSKHFLEQPLTASYSGEPDRVRHCASMDGNAIWYSVRLGLEDERTRGLVDRLIGWQWPDGSWNCDQRLHVVTSSFQESLIPARSLWAYGQAHSHQPSLDAAQRVAELGRIDDPRCAAAIGLLECKQLPDGGFPLEEPNAPTSTRVASRHSYANWGPSGMQHSNPLVSLAALAVLRARRVHGSANVSERKAEHRAVARTTV